MTLRTSIQLAGATLLVGLAVVGCGGRQHLGGPLKPWPLSTDPIVFQDNFTGAVDFQAFGGSDYHALSVDTSEQYEGTGCLKITVPNVGWAGGAFTIIQPRDLTRYNTLSFYAKASKAVKSSPKGKPGVKGTLSPKLAQNAGPSAKTGKARRA